MSNQNLKEAEKRLALASQLASCLHDKRAAHLVRHSFEELIMTRIFQMLYCKQHQKHESKGSVWNHILQAWYGWTVHTRIQGSRKWRSVVVPLFQCQQNENIPACCCLHTHALYPWERRKRNFLGESYLAGNQRKDIADCSKHPPASHHYAIISKKREKRRALITSALEILMTTSGTMVFCSLQKDGRSPPPMIWTRLSMNIRVF